MAISRPIDATDLPEPTRGRRFAAAARDFIRRRPLGAAGAFIVLLMLVVAVTATVIAPYDPLAVDFGAMLGPPSVDHWLGTDAFGRDVLSRLIYGSRTALIVGFGAAFFGATLGAVLGVASAYFGGRIDLFMQLIMTVFISFPLIILPLAIVVLLRTYL